MDPESMVTEIGTAGAILYIWGCCQYAIGKGYSVVMGLLGVITVLGLIALLVIPDRRKTVARPLNRH